MPPRAEIIETLASYGPRNRAELIAATQLIACTMSALSVMAEAEAADMSPSMRLRFRGCANNLNRHGEQAQKTLEKRLACDLPVARDPAAEAAADAAADAADAVVIEQLRQTKLMIEAGRQRLSETNPAVARRLLPTQQDGPDQPPWGSAMLAAAAHPAIPPHAASAA